MLLTNVKQEAAGQVASRFRHSNSNSDYLQRERVFNTDMILA